MHAISSHVTFQNVNFNPLYSYLHFNSFLATNTFQAIQIFMKIEIQGNGRENYNLPKHTWNV